MTKLLTPRPKMILATILTGYLLILLDISIMMSALPRIHAALGFSSTSLSWAQNAYTLVFGGLLLLGARMGDRFGRRRAFIIGIAIFALASIDVGLAQTPLVMIIGRAAQGIGAAMLAPATLALLSTTFTDPQERTRAMAAYGAMAGLGITIGLLLGGALTQLVSWRLGFFINAPVGLVTAFAALRFFPADTPNHSRLALAPALASTAGISLVVFAIVNSVSAGWLSLTTLGSIVVGIALIGWFIRSQRHAESPLLPLSLFAHRERASAYLARFLFVGSMVSCFFFLTQFMQLVKGYNPLLAGIAFLPVTLAAFTGARLTPRLLNRYSRMGLTVAAFIVMLIGMGWLSRIGINTPYLVGIAIPLGIFGLGQGISLSALTASGLADVPAEQAGAAGGLVNVAHQVGGSFGLGVMVTIFASVSATHGESARALLADRVSTVLTGSTVLVALGLIVSVIGLLAQRSAAQRLAAVAVARQAVLTPAGPTAAAFDSPTELAFDTPTNYLDTIEVV